MDKKPIGYTAGKGTILDKKVPKNSKYDHIEAKLLGKTGTTIKDIAFMSTHSPIQATNKSPKKTASSSTASSPPLSGKCLPRSRATHSPSTP
jgi:hypothetical protein